MPDKPMVDKVGGTGMEGSKSEYTVLAAGITNLIMLVLNIFFSIEISGEIVAGINAVFGYVLALTLGSRMTRTENAAKAAQASQPGSDKASSAHTHSGNQGEQL